MKKLVVIVGLVAALAAASFAGDASKGSWTGWVSDEHCGAKINLDCAKKCAEAGKKIVFVTEDKNLVAVANPDKLRGHEGHHVKVSGSLANNTLTVTEVSMLKDQSLPK